MKNILLSFILFCCFFKGQSQVVEISFSSKIDTATLISYYEQIGYHADFIQEFEIQSLLALINYPELKNINIVFNYSAISTTMSCKSVTSSVFGERVYEITINNDSTFNGPLLADIPFNAQIGIIAHEYAHIVDYEEKGLIGLVSTGIEYVNEGTRDEFEKRIDLLTIQHGYGWQLYDWAAFVQESSIFDDEYKQYKAKFYLLPSEIKEKMDGFTIYE